MEFSYFWGEGGAKIVITPDFKNLNFKGVLQIPNFNFFSLILSCKVMICLHI